MTSVLTIVEPVFPTLKHKRDVMLGTLLCYLSLAQTEKILKAFFHATTSTVGCLTVPDTSISNTAQEP